MDTLQNMRAFSCVAEAGSFTAAAVQLDTTTANVSRAVSNARNEGPQLIEEIPDERAGLGL